MAFTKPYFAAGVDIPNCNFQLPGDVVAGLAAGWTATGTWPAGVVAQARSGDYGGVIGRPREQLLYSDGPRTFGFDSAPSRPGIFSNGATVKVFGAMEMYCAAANNAVSLIMRQYSVSGTLLTSTTIFTAATAATGVQTGSASVTIHASASYYRIGISIEQVSVGGAYFYFTFAGLGAWNGNTAGSFQPSRYPIHPGTGYRSSSPFTNRYRSESGRVRVIDKSRAARQAEVTLAFSVMPNSDRLLFERLDALNNGTIWDANYGSASPVGGAWPILLLPGHTGMPGALMCDLTSGLSLEPDAEWGRQDPPCWQGALTFTERT